MYTWGAAANNSIMMVKSSDFRISDAVRAVFRCDEESVTVQIICEDKAAGAPMTYTREEAVALGNRIIESGSWGEFPVSGVPVDALKGFGHRLRQYGLHGS
jgi:hypothetical protein